MADTKISGMSAAAALTGSEVLPVVQSASNVKATTQQVVDAAMTTGLSRRALGSINSNTTVDWSIGSYTTATIAGSLTFTFSNPAPAGKACVAYLELTNGGSAVITWPVSVTWAGATAPTLRTSGVDLLRFYTHDGGSSWFGELASDEQSFDASAIASGTIATARLGSGTANSGAFLRGDQTWAAVSVSPGGSTTQLQYNNAGAFNGMSGTAWDNTNRSLTITGATVTTSKPVFDLSQTWNAGAVAFTALKLNVTNTASANSSKVVDIQIGGSTVAGVNRWGQVLVQNSSANGGSITTATGTGDMAIGAGTGGGSLYLAANGSDIARITSTTGLMFGQIWSLGWANNATLSSATGADLFMLRDAAGTLAQRNGTSAQTLRVYGTYTDSSNYVRVSLSGSSTAVTLAAQTAGTGADDVPVVITPAGTAQVEIGNGVQFTEMTAPSAPSANKVILYAQDNGAGKTQLMALFPTGVAQQVAIEP